MSLTSIVIVSGVQGSGKTIFAATMVKRGTRMLIAHARKPLGADPLQAVISEYDRDADVIIDEISVGYAKEIISQVRAYYRFFGRIFLICQERSTAKFIEKELGLFKSSVYTGAPEHLRKIPFSLFHVVMS